jgi:hypothetical protein
MPLRWPAKAAEEYRGPLLSENLVLVVDFSDADHFALVPLIRVFSGR